MGQTKSRKYNRYTLAFKEQVVRIANHPNIKAMDVAESLGLHSVMLYRWQMEDRRGELTEGVGMNTKQSSQNRKDSLKRKTDDLKQAQRRIRQLEKELALREDEIDLLKKAERFFAKKKK